MLLSKLALECETENIKYQFSHTASTASSVCALRKLRVQC